MKSLRLFMDSFLFTFGGDAVSNFQLMSGGDPARCGDLQERRDYGGKSVKRPTKIKQKSNFHGVRAEFGPTRFLPRSVTEFASQLIFRQKKTLTLWNNFIKKA
jgi:hypothetical protein